MISGTYILSGALLLGTAYLFHAGLAERDHDDRVLVRWCCSSPRRAPVRRT